MFEDVWIFKLYANCTQKCSALKGSEGNVNILRFGKTK